MTIAIAEEAMETSAITASMILGWIPMLLGIRSTRDAGCAHADGFERTLLALTWVACIAITVLSAGDAAHSFVGREVIVGAGILLHVSAMSVWSRAREAMGASFAQIGPARDLVSRGLYRHLRHPMYVSTMAATLGLAIAGGRAREYVCWSMLAVVLAIRAAREERGLRRQFGERWFDYARVSVGVFPCSMRRISNRS